MDSSCGKNDSVPITAKVDLVTKSITGIQIGEADNQESTRTGEESLEPSLNGEPDADQ